jgi:5-methylcytosine-specific restriction endonuclease McrA
MPDGTAYASHTQCIRAAVLRVWPHYAEDARALDTEVAWQLRHIYLDERGVIRWSRFRLGILLKERLSEAQNHRCCYCGIRTLEQIVRGQRDRQATFEHIIPVWLGGSDHPDNLAIACSACNQEQSARCTPEDIDAAFRRG